MTVRSASIVWQIIVIAAAADSTISFLRASKNAAAQQKAETDSLIAGIQGALLLDQAMSLRHNGPKPSPKLEAQMAKAGPLTYNSYELLVTAQTHLEAAAQRLRTGSHASSTIADITTGEQLIQRAKLEMKQGDDLAGSTRSAFETEAAQADPLGPPPEVPREWDSVSAMSQRSKSKLAALQERVLDVKRIARQNGMSLISVKEHEGVRVASEGLVPLSDPYGEKQDSQLLEFLSKE